MSVSTRRVKPAQVVSPSAKAPRPRPATAFPQGDRATAPFIAHLAAFMGKVRPRAYPHEIANDAIEIASVAMLRQEPTKTFAKYGAVIGFEFFSDCIYFDVPWPNAFGKLTETKRLRADFKPHQTKRTPRVADAERRTT
jgi:hypothetical protein